MVSPEKWVAIGCRACLSNEVTGSGSEREGCGESGRVRDKAAASEHGGISVLSMIGDGLQISRWIYEAEVFPFR